MPKSTSKKSSGKLLRRLPTDEELKDISRESEIRESSSSATNIETDSAQRKSLIRYIGGDSSVSPMNITTSDLSDIMLF